LEHTKNPLKGKMAKLQKEAKDTGERAYKVMKGAKEAGMDKIRRILPKTGRSPNESRRRRPQRRRPTTDMVLTSTRTLQLVSEKREPTVQVVVELNKVYQVIAKDPDNAEQEVMM
jgi:ribosomal protein L15